MAFHTPDPVARIGTFTSLSKQRATAAYDSRMARARERFTVARYAAGLRETGLSYRAIVAQVTLAVESGLLPPSARLSHEHIRSLIAGWTGGRQSVHDYLEAPRCGRRVVTDPRLVTMIALAVRVQDYGSKRRLSDRVATEAARLGVHAPSYDTIKRLVASHGRVARSAAAHGTRSAQIDALPHSTVPARRAHDVWVLDELDAPFYARVFDPDTELWVSARPSIITIVDQRTSVCVAHWVADPARRRDPETTRIMRAGFDAHDVLGTLLAAASRELATPSTAAFAGYLPQVLRWDNHATHGSLRPILTQLGRQLALDVGSFYASAGDTPDASFADWEEEEAYDIGDPRPLTVPSEDGIAVPRLPRYRPINRGKIERKIGFLKLLCADLPNHMDRVVPIDRLEVDIKRQRDIIAGSGGRTTRRDPIDVRRLPSIEECRALIEGRVHFYNHTHVSRMSGVPRSAVYAQHTARRTRKGTDLLLGLDTKTAYVTSEGIVHHHDGIATAFAYAVPGKFVFPLDVPVTYKADPLLRAIFVSMDGRLYCLPPKIDWASAPGRAEEVARTQSSIARFYAGEAIAARGATFDATFGPGAANTDQARAKATLDLQPRAQRADAEVPTATPVVRPSAIPPATPSLIRPMTYRSRVDHLKPREPGPHET